MTKTQKIEIGLERYFDKIEKRIDDNHIELKGIINSISQCLEKKADKTDLIEHKNNHWKISSLTVTAGGLVAGIIGWFKQ